VRVDMSDAGTLPHLTRTQRGKDTSRQELGAIVAACLQYSGARPAGDSSGD
jgi:hypothetical protein